jgi:hypothetical protein
MFDISPDDVHRFPAARLHDREQPNAVGHQILRSPDSHRMAGKILNNTWVEPPGVVISGRVGWSGRARRAGW